MSGTHDRHNVRVPSTSPIFQTHASSFELSDFENLGRWTTRVGTMLANRRVFTASVRLDSLVYALISLV